jgi:hypothetical protein
MLSNDEHQAYRATYVFLICLRDLKLVKLVTCRDTLQSIYRLFVLKPRPTDLLRRVIL